MNISISRTRRTELTAEQFAQLLKWLAPDMERAGEKYEQIRRGLIKIFRCRGSAIPEELAFCQTDGLIPLISNANT